MKYFLNLNLNWKPAAADLQQYIFQNFNVNDLQGWTSVDAVDVISKCPNLLKMLEPLETKISWLAFIVFHDRVSPELHIDDDKQNTSRLLMPILNCVDSETCFYISSKPPTSSLQPNGVLYYKLDPNCCQLIDKLSLNDGIYLFRVREPHLTTISEKSNFPRISCTIALEKDFTYLLD